MARAMKTEQVNTVFMREEAKLAKDTIFNTKPHFQLEASYHGPQEILYSRDYDMTITSYYVEESFSFSQKSAQIFKK